jgi:hypothetical protein
MLDVPERAQVRTMIMQSSGEPAVRAILVDGKEIHRCERDRASPADGRTDEASRVLEGDGWCITAEGLPPSG